MLTGKAKDFTTCMMHELARVRYQTYVHHLQNPRYVLKSSKPNMQPDQILEK